MHTNPMRNVSLYEVLEVSSTARLAVIRAAYRCLAQEYHPDRNLANPDSGARMSLINCAYTALSDPLQRAQYDQQIGIGSTERRDSRCAPNQGKVYAGGVNARSFAYGSLD